jgi:bis(5'-nucleosyl)-tetraphosphatase (symmetrical)
MKIDNLTLVHAGLTNKINLDTAKKKDLERTLWIRTLDENQKTLSLNDDTATAKFWSEYYDGNQGIVVYGHQPFNEVKVDKYSIGIDTGCVYGNKLTALIISDTKAPMQNYKIIDIQSTQKEDIQNEFR